MSQAKRSSHDEAFTTLSSTEDGKWITRLMKRLSGESEGLPRWTNGKLKVFEDGLLPTLSNGKKAKWKFADAVDCSIEKLEESDVAMGMEVAEILKFVDKIERERGSNNFLKRWMVADALISSRKKIATLRETWGPRPEIDTELIYKVYCQRRCPPPPEFMNSVQAVGMTLVRSPPPFKGVAYVSFFIPGYGSWLPPTKCLGAIASFLSALYYRGVPLVVFDDRAEEDLASLLHAYTKKEYLPVIENQKTSLDLFSLAWEKLGVDALSWVVRADVSRLLEEPPKNPIEHSFMTNWNLRWEQIVYITVSSMLALALSTGANVV